MKIFGRRRGAGVDNSKGTRRLVDGLGLFSLGLGTAQLVAPGAMNRLVGAPDDPTTRAMQWEAVAINADFWSQVLQAQSLKPLDFALGAVMALRRKQLEEIGGFAALAGIVNACRVLCRNNWICSASNFTCFLVSPAVSAWPTPARPMNSTKLALSFASALNGCERISTTIA